MYIHITLLPVVPRCNAPNARRFRSMGPVVPEASEMSSRCVVFVIFSLSLSF